MAKSKRSASKKQQGNQQAAKTGRKRRVQSIRAGLDKAALDYARLLEDPCRADLVRPTYNFGSSGYLARVKQIVAIGGNSGAVDAYTAFAPANDADNATSSGSMWHHGYSTTTGGTLGTLTGANGPAWLRSSNVGYYRPVAGCLKVHYTGSELSRSGLISLGLAPGLALAAGETGVGSVSGIVPSTAKTVRLGSEPHEVRWLPLSSDDQIFAASDQPTTGGYSVLGSSVVYVLAQGVPAGTVNVEVDFVYEWVPDMAYASSSMEVSISPPPSRNTLADVLRFLDQAYGGLQAFATSSGGRKLLGVVARGAYSVMNSVGAPLALTM